ncbi:MAG: quinohemoprotein ethanol dehydrogenase [Hyphomicrobiaceae bacterium]|jgi:quinohemoprotein ethanol dehydrogenase
MLAMLVSAVPTNANAEPSNAVDLERLAAVDTEPGNWLTHGRDYGEQRFSPLTQINVENVDELGLAWVYETNTYRGMEATPLVIDGVMYATGIWSVVYALDAATGEELWTYDPKVPRAKGRDACCDVVNRGLAAWNGRLYLGALDGRLIAIDAQSGKPVWETMTVDPEKPYTITGAPRVVDGKVIIGNGGAEFGVRGYFGAYDADSGQLLWRFYTVPASADGPHEHRELDVAAATWSRDSMWETGLGATVWDSMAYDPELDLLYIGTGNASVYAKELRSPGGGDNLFVSSILAIDPDDGQLVWHYQTTPGDQWDYTATQSLILADLEIDGRIRQVVMQAPKNGFFYVLDRGTGELLDAQPYIDRSWATHIDLATGRPAQRPEAAWSDAKAMVTPGIVGGHNWHPMSYSPQTGLAYIPTFESVYLFEAQPAFVYAPGAFNTGENWEALTRQMEGYEELSRSGNVAHLTAYDPVKGEMAWRIPFPLEIPAGTLATAGNLVFQGRTSGGLSAYQAERGAKLWEGATGTGIIAPPVTYTVEGEQYVAVLAGVGGSQGGHYTNIRNRNDGRILAFKLGGKAALEPVEPRTPAVVEIPKTSASSETIDRGRVLYASHCGRCHGLAVVGSGLYPDLRFTLAGVFDVWDRVVLEGLFANRGMASFADVLTVEDSAAIRAYVSVRAHHSPTVVERLVNWVSSKVRIPARWVAD